MPKKEANDLKIAIKSCFTTLVEDTTLIQNAATPYPVEFAFSKIGTGSQRLRSLRQAVSAWLWC